MSYAIYHNTPDNMIHGMDEERKEMICESEDDFRTQRDFDTNRQQPLQSTGSEYVRMRRYRSVSVCLVLLCVLLLTAVIVLCVKFTKETKIEIPEQDQRPHKPEWITHKLSSYYISSEWRNWSESRQDCLQRGADLLIINNKEEQDYIIQVTSANLVWIGLTLRKEEGSWNWVDGTNMTFVFWRPGEPNNKVLNEDCAVSQYGWSDYPCHFTFVWICEKGLEV
nr:hepatic lectin-like [Misgurnus anguillicaudatus]